MSFKETLSVVLNKTYPTTIQKKKKKTKLEGRENDALLHPNFKSDKIIKI